MNSAVILEALARRPFEPIRVVMSSGESYEVRHPEWALLTKTNLYIGLPGSKRDNVPQRAVHCAMLHIASIETLQAA